jgi:hypothetical protein
MAVGDIVERTDRPAYVAFKRVAVEDKAASIEQKRFVAKDVDYACITPPYSKDRFEIKIAQWKTNMEQDVRNDRMPKEWQDRYLAAYDAWLNGQQMPLDGTAIKGWGVISPAQQEMLIHVNILTVEDLAAANDEGLKRIGMGAIDLRNKAKAWVAQVADKGPLTIEVAALKAHNTVLASSLESMSQQIAELKARLPEYQVPRAEPQTHSITADDIMPENDAKPRTKPK